ncbi:MAG: hypothetical protein IPO36_06945 [Anaerolineales bacterium]|jgi:hypothetical protein|uniref:hypothetical protein n=1 Tax=Candidatus Villigracilis affinis TaxID=3140682 RepID=UPI001B6C025E|nr:hypothetical protein [Anaerolineales bacterium]MBK9601568.1 hypothetical protein [Anaerolineales bacterium]MBL0345430.1 hypothetical protein [Anaerolineales bacterium]MBP8047595.1 hypothetical protein [Anaerolineales bacterium]
MESSKASVAAIIFVVIIVGVNFFMYGIVRGLMRSSQKSNMFETLSKSLNPAAQKKDDEIKELRQRVEELEKGKKDNENPSP